MCLYTKSALQPIFDNTYIDREKHINEKVSLYFNTFWRLLNRIKPKRQKVIDFLTIISCCFETSKPTTFFVLSSLLTLSLSPMQCILTFLTWPSAIAKASRVDRPFSRRDPLFIIKQVNLANRVRDMKLPATYVYWL